MKATRVWPSSRHPAPSQVQLGHAIKLTPNLNDVWHVIGVGLDRGESLLVRSELGERAKFTWNPTQRRWAQSTS